MKTEFENFIITKICRTCLSVDEPLADMFDQTKFVLEEKISIGDILTSIACIQVCYCIQSYTIVR